MRAATHALIIILTFCVIDASINTHAENSDKDKIREKNTPMKDHWKTNEWKITQKYNCDNIYKYGEKKKTSISCLWFLPRVYLLLELQHL